MRKPDPQRLRSAMRTLALFRSKQAVKHQLAAKGEKVAHYSARDITLRAEEYLAQHREQLMAKAEEEFARWQS